MGIKDTQETSPDLLETRFRSDRGQTNLNIELGIVGQNAVPSVMASPGSTGASVGSSGIITEYTGGGGGGGSTCPEVSQWVRIRGEDGGYTPIRAVKVKVGMYLWNPITREFERVKKARTVKNLDLIAVSDDRREAVGSATTPLISAADDATGRPLSLCQRVLACLGVSGMSLVHTKLAKVEPRGKGDVREIVTKGPTHIYASGSDPNEMFVFHNLKPLS